GGEVGWGGGWHITFGQCCPPFFGAWVQKMEGKHTDKARDYTTIHPRRFGELDLPTRARARNHDLVYRPWKDGFAMRLHHLQYMDPGNYNKGTLGGLQVEYRDPTADVRLLEFCFSGPTEQFLPDGRPRALAHCALADRLPKRVLEETRRGVQVADWHEDFAAARDSVVDELDRLEACPPAAAILDLPRLRRLTANWPSDGWERDDIVMSYRYALLRGIAVGHFLRRATGANR